jgi:hypothetical protein
MKCRKDDAKEDESCPELQKSRGRSRIWAEKGYRPHTKINETPTDLAGHRQ